MIYNLFSSAPQGPVTNLTASATSRTVILTFMRPATVTGMLSFDVSYTPGSGSETGSASPITIFNLAPATAYTFTVNCFYSYTVLLKIAP